MIQWEKEQAKGVRNEDEGDKGRAKLVFCAIWTKGKKIHYCESKKTLILSSLFF